MGKTNQIGNRGENTAERCFARPIGGHYGFETSFLGDKAQLLDFRIALLNEAGSVFGPHFYVQVKTHQVKSGSTFASKFSASEIKSSKAGLVPVYLIGVELSGDTSENVWVCGIEGQVTLPSIPKTHDLKSTATLIQIYTEVLAHFNKSTYKFKSTLK